MQVMSVIVAMPLSDEVVRTGHGIISSMDDEYVACTSIVDVSLRGLRLRFRCSWPGLFTTEFRTMVVITVVMDSSALLCDLAHAEPELDMADGQWRIVNGVL